MNNKAEAPSLFGVILAGGSGTRFWPLSRLQYPKQVLRLLGTESMLQATIERLLPLIPLERLIVVTNASQEDVIRLELHKKNWEGVKLVIEPLGRNTAAAVGLAAASLPETAEPAVLAVFPADHYIKEQEEFLAALTEGAHWAAQGSVVTFGITPATPETGYGYIQAGAPLDETTTARRGVRFIEKPPLTQAERFLAEGNFYWNSGIFLFRRDVLLEAMASLLPDLYQGLQALQGDPGPAKVTEIYQDLPNISLDHGILEKISDFVVLPVNLGWSDVGTWGALRHLFPQDAQGNVTLGRTVSLENKDCLIYAQDRLVASLGLENMVVVDTPDATLICPLTKIQEVKDIVAELNRQNMTESICHLTVERPWGEYTVIESGPGYKVKAIVVYPGKRLSLQYHNYRAEHWVVVQGTALVTIGKEVTRVHANESVYVPVKTPHRLENQSPENLKIIEVQTGPYLEEDDIIRLNDDFWR